jgi:hypothetical protein
MKCTSSFTKSNDRDLAPPVCTRCCMHTKTPTLRITHMCARAAPHSLSLTHTQKWATHAPHPSENAPPHPPTPAYDFQPLRYKRRSAHSVPPVLVAGSSSVGSVTVHLNHSLRRQHQGRRLGLHPHPGRGPAAAAPAL